MACKRALQQGLGSRVEVCRLLLASKYLFTLPFGESVFIRR